MQIIINGERRELSEIVSISEMLVKFDLPNERIAVELNREIVRKKDWTKTIVKDADKIEIVHFVGGG